jgi:hypothetical protein
MTFFDIVTENSTVLLMCRKKASDFFVSCYLKKLFQLGGLPVNRRMSRKCEKNCEQLIVLNQTVKI